MVKMDSCRVLHPHACMNALLPCCLDERDSGGSSSPLRQHLLENLSLPAIWACRSVLDGPSPSCRFVLARYRRDEW